MVLWAVPNMRLKPKSVSRLMYLSIFVISK